MILNDPRGCRPALLLAALLGTSLLAPGLRADDAAMLEFLDAALLEPAPTDVPATTRRARLEHAAEALAAWPLVDEDRARIAVGLGRALIAVGSESIADRLLGTAIVVLDAREESDPALLARAQVLRGRLMARTQRIPAGRAMLEEALASLEALHAAGDPRLRPQDLPEGLLASVDADAREIDLAWLRLDRALELAEAALGADHPCTIEARLAQAGLFARTGAWPEALRRAEAVLDDATRLFGDAAPLALEADRLLATTLARSAVDRREKAQAPAAELEPLFEEAAGRLEHVLTIQQRAYGPEERETGLTRSGLGRVYAEWAATVEDPAQRRAIIGRRLVMQRGIHAERAARLGPDHPQTLRALANVGALCSRSGRFEEGLEVWTELLAIRRRLLPEDHADVLIARTGRARALWEVGRREEGEPELHAIQAFLESLPPDDPRRRLARPLGELLDALERGELGSGEDPEEGPDAP